MKRIISTALAALLAVSVFIIPLSGVKESFRVQNVEKSAMVKSVGFDAQNGATVSFVQSVIADASPQHAQGVISATGESFAAAEKQAQILADKYLTLSYAAHFLIGEPTAKQGIQSVIDFLLSSQILQLSSYLYICEESAETMLETISLDDISTDEVLTNLNLAGKEEGYYYPVTVLEAAKALEENSCLLIPLIGQKEEGKNTAKKSVPVFKGYAVLVGGKLRTVLGREQSRAYNCLAGKLKRSVVACPAADVTINKSRVKVNMAFENEALRQVRFDVFLHESLADAKGNALEGNTFLHTIKAQQAEELSAQMRSLFALAQKENLDIFNFHAEARRQSWGRCVPTVQEVSSVPVSLRLRQEVSLNYSMQ